MGPVGQACEESVGACGRGLRGSRWRTELWAPPSTHLEVGPCPLLESGWAVAVKDTRLASSAVAPWPCCPHSKGYPSPPPVGAWPFSPILGAGPAPGPSPPVCSPDRHRPAPRREPHGNPLLPPTPGAGPVARPGTQSTPPSFGGAQLRRPSVGGGAVGRRLVGRSGPAALTRPLLQA